MNRLTNFGDFALTRAEMKTVIGGAYACTCNVFNNSGVPASLTFVAKDGACTSAYAGAAFVTYTKNGENYSGYIDASAAADICRTSQWIS
jgi:hypothetical protein